MTQNDHSMSYAADLLAAIERDARGQTDHPITEESIVPGAELLGLYRVESKPDFSGVDNVWRVHHRDWNVDLAMKRPLPRYADEKYISRLAPWF